MTKGSILLIEDSAADFEAAKRAFRKVGLENPLVHVSSGEEALDYLRAPAHRPTLILLDLNMPGMSGDDVLKRVKQSPALKDIPVVILTGSKSRAAIQSCYRLGANAYILKSADFEVLADNIKKLKEHWLDVVELPQVFDERGAGEKVVFSVLEEESHDAAEGASREVHLSPEEVYTKIMGVGAQKFQKGEVRLSPQEIETLTWTARGKSRWEIGVILGVSEDTVKARLEKIRQKLGASNTTHAIAMAILHGLLLPDSANKNT